jgi:hypothetical protein
MNKKKPIKLLKVIAVDIPLRIIDKSVPYYSTEIIIVNDCYLINKEAYFPNNQNKSIQFKK